TARTGTVVWTLACGSGTISTPTSPTSTVTGLLSLPDALPISISNGTCAPSADDVIITSAAAPTVANAGPDQTVCGPNATLAGNTAVSGNGVWTLASGSGTITTPTSPTSTVTGLGAGANTFRWT